MDRFYRQYQQQIIAHIDANQMGFASGSFDTKSLIKTLRIPRPESADCTPIGRRFQLG